LINWTPKESTLLAKIMPVDSTARPNPPQATLDDDYRSFCAVLSESTRGRNFLAEIAKRNRHADTEMLLARIDRLEALMRAEGSALERLRGELRMLLIAIRLARLDIDGASPPDKTVKLATLLDTLEHRIDALAEGKAAENAQPADEPGPALAALIVVPVPDEPELPIPSPARTQPTIVLVHDDATAELTNAPLGLAVIEPAVTVKPVPPPADPLAAIMALSEAERIALFT
jgi:hypothetical protein